MSGASLSIKLDSLKALQSRLKRLADVNVPEILDGIGALVESQTRQRLAEDKTGPDGQPWDEWSEAYAKNRHSGHGLLENEGDLIDSIHYTVDTEGVRIGTNLVYGAIHQFGGDEVGINVPPRPFLGLSLRNEREIADLVEGMLR